MQSSLTEEHALLERLREFAVAFAPELKPDVTQEELDLAFNRALYSMSQQEAAPAPVPELSFAHECRNIACNSAGCALCRQNPDKQCAAGVNFDVAYADGQVLRARCGADVCVELVDSSTGQPLPACGIEVQLGLVDGDLYNPAAHDPISTIHMRDKNDNGVVMLQTAGKQQQGPGGLTALLQGGRARLPDLCVADKTDTSKFGGAATRRFALLAVAMQRGSGGQLAPIDGLGPVVSAPFKIKTQRAITDFHKPAHPHFRDRMTQLHHVGSTTADKLQRVREHLGPAAPMGCAETVEDLKQLVAWAEGDRVVQEKLIKMLNMTGRSKHKWDELRRALDEAVVYDDAAPRLWAQPPGGGGGAARPQQAPAPLLLYTTKQAQVQPDRPAGLAQRVLGPDGATRLQVAPLPDVPPPEVAALALAAAECWRQPGHPGWQVATEPIDWGVTPPVSMGVSPAAVAAHAGLLVPLA